MKQMQDFQSFVLGTANRKTHALPKSPYHTIYTIYTMLTYIYIPCIYIYTMYIWNRITQSIPIRPRSQQPASNPQRSLRRPSLALWRYEHLQPQRGCLLRVKGPECRVALGSWLLIIQWSNMMPNNTPCHIFHSWRFISLFTGTECFFSPFGKIRISLKQNVGVYCWVTAFESRNLWV